MPSFAPVMPTGQSLKDGAGFNGANPGANLGAAAAISRFAPQNNVQTPENMVPSRFPAMPKADGLVGGSE
jgi:hypothetical protein